MELGTLTAISPVDGRYRQKLDGLAPYFSEMGFIRYKVQVEVEYFIALCEAGLPALKDIDADLFGELRKLYTEFKLEDGIRVKEIEKVTNHDVKAVEYFIKERFDEIDPRLKTAKEYIHFGLTSQDINNTSVPMMLRDALHNVLIPGYESVIAKLQGLATEWDGISMLARTHGQPASPTTLPKEIRVFVARIDRQLDALRALDYPGKFGGATGNFNAHFLAFPETDWHAFAREFLGDRLGLRRSSPTTQIEHYDGLGQIFDNIKRLNTILTDLCIDAWLYISQDYFKQKTVAHEVGSSAMPHKVNPIDFENAEGNLGLANAILEFLSRKLPVSRLQRDLTDSTVLRNTGVGVAHTWLAIQSLLKGLGKLEVNRAKIAADLESNWAVVAEAIQTILRRENYPNPYERLKALTRGKSRIDEALIAEFIEGLDVSDAIKAELKAVRPENYVGREG
ncbi:MAG: adenylosuccinate lyase [Bacteroidota bacterium]